MSAQCMASRTPGSPRPVWDDLYPVESSSSPSQSSASRPAEDEEPGRAAAAAAAAVFSAPAAPPGPAVSQRTRLVPQQQSPSPIPPLQAEEDGGSLPPPTEYTPLVAQGSGGSSPWNSSIDLEEVRKKALPTADALRLLEWENEPWYMVGYMFGRTAIQVATVMGAFFFVKAAGDTVTPRCFLYGDAHSLHEFIPDSWTHPFLQRNVCNVATFCFWTYPLVCALAAVFTSVKNLLDTRLYYECLLHGILLEHQGIAFLYSPIVWYLLCYGVAAMGSIVYIKSTAAMLAASYPELVYGLLAYLSPIGAFVAVLCVRWSVEWYLIPLSKFCEGCSPQETASLIGRSLYVPESRLRKAVNAAEGYLAMRGDDGRPTPVLSSPEYFNLLASLVAKGVDPPRNTGRGCCGTLLRILCPFPKAYWVYRALFCSYLDDSRSKTFRYWVRAYVAFALAAGAMILRIFFHTGLQVLCFEKLLPGCSPGMQW